MILNCINDYIHKIIYNKGLVYTKQSLPYYIDSKNIRFLGPYLYLKQFNSYNHIFYMLKLYKNHTLVYYSMKSKLNDIR